MALLQCNLSVSWQTQMFSGICYATIMVAILLAPWPDQNWPIWLILVGGIALESIFAQQRINQTKGVLILLDKNSLAWNHQEWSITRSPFILNFGIFLSLRSERSGKKTQLWIAADSMNRQQWRNLRYELFQSKVL